MNNSTIICKTSHSDYYGNVNYRLVLIHDFMAIMKHMVDLDLVDEENKNYGGTYVPRNIKESLKFRDKISLSHHYVKEFRSLCGSYNIIKLSDDVRMCYAFFTVLEEDNKDWDYTGTGYYNLTKKKKLPIGIREKDIQKFYAKYGNYFPQYDFKTIDEMKAYFSVLYPDNKQ